jgi:uncharacterized MAPEG superfamily protein
LALVGAKTNRVMTKSPLFPAMGMGTFVFGVGFAIAYFMEKGQLTFSNVCDLKMATLAFCVYLLVVFLFMFRQALTKMVNAELLENKHHHETESLDAFIANTNRSFENALEQMPIFLTLFFFYALLCNPVRAGQLGFAYVALTALYPCFHDSEKPQKVFVSTFPRYLLNAFMLGALVLSALRTVPGPTAPTPPPTPSPTPPPTQRPVDPTPPPPTPRPYEEEKEDPTPPPPTPRPYNPTPPPTAPPTPNSYKPVKGLYYSNDKYLADFYTGMTLDICQDRCDHWQDVCPRLCKQKLDCLLSDNIDVRHFSRDESCAQTCTAIAWHPDTKHCTLFPAGLTLMAGGGRGEFLARPGYPAPLTPGSGATGLALAGHGIAAQNLLTPFSLVVGVVAVVQFVFMLARWVRRPHPEIASVVRRTTAEEPFVPVE